MMKEAREGEMTSGERRDDQMMGVKMVVGELGGGAE